LTGFAEALDAFATKTSAKADMVVRKVVFDIDAALVLKSPVGNPDLWAKQSLPAPKGYVGGRFRANWQYGENTIPLGELWNPITGPFPPENPIDVAMDAGGKVHYLVNNLPYAYRLEYGWSTQAPLGMVQTTVVEFLPIVALAAKAVE
jgi:hypothetical protein